MESTPSERFRKRSEEDSRKVGGATGRHDESIVSRTDAASSMMTEVRTTSCSKLPKLSARLAEAKSIHHAHMKCREITEPNTSVGFWILQVRDYGSDCGFSMKAQIYLAGSGLPQAATFSSPSQLTATSQL